jgi:hypothetical protein
MRAGNTGAMDVSNQALDELSTLQPPTKRKHSRGQQVTAHEPTAKQTNRQATSRHQAVRCPVEKKFHLLAVSLGPEHHHNCLQLYGANASMFTVDAM